MRVLIVRCDCDYDSMCLFAACVRRCLRVCALRTRKACIVQVCVAFTARADFIPHCNRFGRVVLIVPPPPSRPPLRSSPHRSTDHVQTLLRYTETPLREGGIGAVAYPLFSDCNHKLSKATGVLFEDGGVAFRAVFIVDAKNIVRHFSVNDFSVGRNAEEVSVSDARAQQRAALFSRCVLCV